MADDDLTQPTYSERVIARETLNAAIKSFEDSDRTLRATPVWTAATDEDRAGVDSIRAGIRHYHGKLTELEATHTDLGLSSSPYLRDMRAVETAKISRERARQDRELERLHTTRGRIERGELLRAPDGNFVEVPTVAARWEGMTSQQLRAAERMQETFDRLDASTQLETVMRELRTHGPNSPLLTAIELELALVHELSPTIRRVITETRLQLSDWKDEYEQRVFKGETLNFHISRAIEALGLVEVKPRWERT
jgi:hypothetical protein